MDVKATKTHAEREDEEAERLVRPAPHYKPPRHDRRKHDIDPDRDSDTDDDPDIQKDKDKSRNFKDIGGSVGRIMRRFAEQSDKIPARSKDTGRVVYISPDTLKERPGDYEAVDQEDEPEGGSKVKEAPEKGSPKEEDAPADDDELAGHGETLRGLGKDNPRVQMSLNELTNPKTQLGGMAKENSNFPASSVLKGVALPEGINTLGDVVRALRAKPSSKPKAPIPGKVPSKKGPKEPDTEPASESAPSTDEGPKKAEKPKAKEKETVKEEPAPTPDDVGEVKKWVAQGEHKKSDFQSYLDSIPTSDQDPVSGEILVLDPKTKARVPFEALAPEAQARLMKSFEGKKKEADTIQKDEAERKETSNKLRETQEAAVKSLDSVEPDTRRLLDSFLDPNSAASDKIRQISADHDLAFVRPEKIFPELKGKLPKGVDTLKQLTQTVKLAGDYKNLSEQAKKNIPVPKREPASPAEVEASILELSDTFPSDVAANIMAMNQHPKDIGELVSTYHKTQSIPVKSASDFAKEASEYYQTKIAAPKKWKDASGKEVPFHTLSPEEQGEAFRQHQMQIMGLSLAAKSRLSKALEMPTYFGKPQVPKQLADQLGNFMLNGGSEKDASLQSTRMFESSRSSGEEALIPDKKVKQLFEQLTPGAKKLAQAYLEGSDYHTAKGKFIGHKAGQFSELDNPKDIVAGLNKAENYFKSRADMYGDARHSGGMTFRVAILNRLRDLDPKKYNEVRSRLDVADADKYDRDHARWEKDHKAWKNKTESKADYRKPASNGEDAPPEPARPIRYDTVRGKPKKKGQDFVNEVVSRSKLARQYYTSTCSAPPSMAQASRTGVYHGVDPVKNYPPAYEGWKQPAQRDIGEPEYKVILAKAREWMGMPVLSRPIKGYNKDEQYRAALDLAIYDGAFNGQIQPNIYNMLLARLAGVPTPGEGQTLLTIREANSRDSSFSLSTPREVSMSTKASAQIRKFAVETAKTHPSLALDLVELADKLASDDQEDQQQQDKQAGQMPPQFRENAEKKKEEAEAKKDDDKDGQEKKASEKLAHLRSVLIRTAASDSQAKQLLMPVLQTLKG